MDQKYIIIIIAAVLLCGVAAYFLFADTTEYTRIDLGENGTSIEVPKNMKTQSNYTALGVMVLKNDNTIVVSFNSAKNGLESLIDFDTVKKTLFKNDSERNVTLKDPSIAGYTLKGEYTAAYASNNTTQDNIIVISKDKRIANHIIDSIQWKTPLKAETDIQNKTLNIIKNITS